MALSRTSENIIEFKPIPSAIIDPTIKASLIAYYGDLKPESQYIQDVTHVVNQARLCLDECMRSPMVAKPAIVLDIDDTSVSHFPSIVSDGFANTEDTIILRYRSASAPAIEPVLRFTQYALDQGVAVFFITARKPHTLQPEENLSPYTIKALEYAGYHDWQGLFLAEEKDKELSTAQFKTNQRKAITENGYKIIVNIGDQPSDLEGGYAEQVFKLPNYLYPKLGGR